MSHELEPPETPLWHLDEELGEHEIANVRGLYYDQDHAIGLWEVDAWGRLDEFAHGRLWQLFEGFMRGRFPQAQRIYTDDAEPFEDDAHNRQFLSSLGYKAFPRSHRVWKKEVTG